MNVFSMLRYDCTGQKKRVFIWILQLYDLELTFFPGWTWIEVFPCTWCLSVRILHSQKQFAHWAVDVSVEFYAFLLRWLPRLGFGLRFSRLILRGSYQNLAISIGSNLNTPQNSSTPELLSWRINPNKSEQIPVRWDGRWSLQEVTSYFRGFILDLVGIWIFGWFKRIWTDLTGSLVTQQPLKNVFPTFQKGWFSVWNEGCFNGCIKVFPNVISVWFRYFEINNWKPTEIKCLKIVGKQYGLIRVTRDLLLLWNTSIWMKTF